MESGRKLMIVLQHVNSELVENSLAGRPTGLFNCKKCLGYCPLDKCLPQQPPAKTLHTGQNTEERCVKNTAADSDQVQGECLISVIKIEKEEQIELNELDSHGGDSGLKAVNSGIDEGEYLTSVIKIEKEGKNELNESDSHGGDSEFKAVHSGIYEGEYLTSVIKIEKEEEIELNGSDSHSGDSEFKAINAAIDEGTDLISVIKIEKEETLEVNEWDGLSEDSELKEVESGIDKANRYIQTMESGRKLVIALQRVNSRIVENSLAGRPTGLFHCKMCLGYCPLDQCLLLHQPPPKTLYTDQSTEGRRVKNTAADNNQVQVVKETCGMDSSKIGMRNASKFFKRGSKRHNSVICNKQYTKKRSLEDHTSIVHQGRKRYICGECDKRFTQKNHLKVHISAIHQGVRHSCSKCNNSYKYERTLNNHIKVKHTVG